MSVSLAAMGNSHPEASDAWMWFPQICQRTVWSTFEKWKIMHNRLSTITVHIFWNKKFRRTAWDLRWRYFQFLERWEFETHWAERWRPDCCSGFRSFFRLKTTSAVYWHDKRQKWQTRRTVEEHPVDIISCGKSVGTANSWPTGISPLCIWSIISCFHNKQSGEQWAII